MNNGRLLSILPKKDLVYYLDESFDEKPNIIFTMIFQMVTKVNMSQISIMKSVIDTGNIKLFERIILSWYLGDNVEELNNYALKMGQISMAEFLYPLDENMKHLKYSYVKSHESGFIWKKESNFRQFTKFLDSAHPTLNENDMSDDGYILAVYYNHPRLVKKILRNNPSSIVSIREDFAIRYACDYGYTEIVKLLVMYQCACMGIKQFNLLNVAIQHNYTDIIKILQNI